ncbi:MAG: hypothetical protein K2V38_10640, partial [Gemmataceae bacterium]|nr:hypothetical protein [Gemmataceae bacterium]
APGGAGEKKDASKLDEKELKDIQDALKDLQGDDEIKKHAARDKLDKTVGPQARKEAEQLMQDLQSPDKDKRAAAEQKLQEMQDALKKEASRQAQQKKDGKGLDGKQAEPKELTKEELEQLAKLAKDLQSKDDEKRKRAEKELDDKLGKANREKLQEEMKNQPPGVPNDPNEEEKLKNQLDKMAREQDKNLHDPTQRNLGTGVKTRDAMEEDARNRLKTAELRLEDFQKKQYDEAFKRKQGFTDEEYQKFLADYERHVEKLRADVARSVASGDKPPTPGGAESGGPLKVGSGKVEGKDGTSSATGGGKIVDPDGFEGARDKFEKLINPKN